MRIKSSFHDYYDIGMSAGMADDILFLREEKIVRPGQDVWNTTNVYITPNDEIIKAYNISFCNQTFRFMIWRGVCYYNYDKLNNAYYEIFGKDINTRPKYKYGRYSRNIKEYLAPEPAKVYIETIPRIKSKGWKARKNKAIKRQVVEKQQTVHELYKSPIVFYGDAGEIRINVPLRRYEFAKVKDPFTAYQELYQYFANQASPEKPIPVVSNSDMIIAKGFDTKYSFRKEKAQ